MLKSPPTLTPQHHRYFLAAFVFFQLAALVNLGLFPYLPVVPFLVLAGIVVFYAVVDHKILLALFVMAIPPSEELNIPVGPIVLRAIDAVFIFAAFIFVLRWLLHNRIKLEDLPVFKPALSGVLIAAVLSLTGTVSLTKSVLEIVQLMQIMMAGYLLYQMVTDEKHLWVIIIAYLSYGVLDTVAVYFKYYTGQAEGRHVGLFESFATELGYCSVISLWLAYMVRKQWAKFAFIVLCVLILGALYLSRGRGIMLITIIMITGSGILWSLSRKKPVYAILSVVFVLAAGFVFYNYFSDVEYQSRYSSIVEGGQFRDVRLLVWSIALKTWNSSPIFGIGVGNAGWAIAKYAPKPFGLALASLLDVKSPHNEYLHFAMQAGFIGLAAAVFLYLSIMWHAVRLFWQNRDTRYNGLSILLLLLATGVTGWSFANDIFLAGHGVFVMLIIAMLARLHQISKRKTD